MQKFLIGLAILIVVVVLAGFAMPTTYAIEKEITIDATPAEVHAWINDLEKWSEWSPWEQEDETIETKLGEKTSGVGASQSWTSKDGPGELTITKSDASTGIAYDMAFIMADEKRAPATCAMTYAEVDGKTKVVWTMEGDIGDFMPPVISGLMTPMMKSMIGGQFDKGLDNLKVKVESAK